jgi:hypothetical protein
MRSFKKFINLNLEIIFANQLIKAAKKFYLLREVSNLIKSNFG